MRTKTLILWLLLFVTIPSFAYDFQFGDLCYNILSNNRVAVVSGVGTYEEIKSVVIPESVTYNGTTYSVTSIGRYAFSNCTSLKTVTIPNSVTSIEREAFYGCIRLTSITIPNGVTSIGNHAFYGCTRLTSVTIPNSVAGIGSYAFSNCTNLTSITIPNSVTTIGLYAFRGCTRLTSVIWNAKECNPGELFSDIAESITSFSFGNEVESIPDYICYKMNHLTSITIPNSVTSIGRYAFSNCTGLTSVTVGNSVTNIEREAFSGCIGLTSITIPNGVTSIGNHAFYGCTGLASVIWNAKECNPGELFSDIAESITSFSFGNEVESIPDYICYKMNHLTSITIPNSVTSIGHYAFSNCTGLTSVTVGNSVTNIGDDAFSGCIGLTSITIPNGVTSIGGSAFYGCTGLTSITIPDGVTSIGNHTFYGCTGLASVIWNAKQCGGWKYNTAPFTNIAESITSFTFGNEVKSIPDYICYKMNNLTSVTIPDGVTSIGGSAFSHCTGLRFVTIPHNVTTIGDDAFYGVHNIVYFGTAYGAPWGAENMNDGYVDGYLFYADATKTTLLYCNHIVTGEIIIPNSVTSIEREAFYGCTGLTSVTIPSSVTSIGDYTFYGCTGLTSVVWNAKNCQGWSQSNDSPFYAEKNKSSITSFAFGNDVKSIPSYLCYGMNKLTSIAIPNSVTGIGSYAFSDCSRLTSITIPSSVREVGNSIVSGCRRLDTVVWNARDCQGWSQYNDAPFYDEKGECSISYFAFGNGVENIPSYLCYGMNVLSSVTIPNSVQTIGQNAFENCKYLEEVSFGMGIEDIGENAFAGDGRIYSVTCYADITPTIYESTFSGVSSNAELHVLANLVKKYKVNEYWGRFTIVPIGADNTTDGTLSVTPSETDATFTWPTNDNADTYTLTIQKGDVVFCTLTFDANGVLQSMRFAAPSRSIAQHTAQAQATGNGFRFVVEGLDRATTYAYSITATDKDETVLSNYSGTFTTQAPTSTEDILSTPSQPTPRKVFRNGQVYILRSDKMYNINGTEM